MPSMNQGITNIYELLAIPAADIEVLKYKPSGKTNKVQIGKGLAMKLIYAIKYVAHMNNTYNNGSMLVEKEFVKLNAVDFKEWHNIEMHRPRSTICAVDNNMLFNKCAAPLRGEDSVRSSNQLMTTTLTCRSLTAQWKKMTTTLTCQSLAAR